MAPRFRRRRAPRKPRRVAKKSSMVKAVRAIAKQEAYKTQETKFASRDFFGLAVYNTLRSFISLASPTLLNTFQPGIAAIGQGAASNRLIGSKVTLVNCFTTFAFNIKSSSNVAADLFVKVYLLQSKNVKNLNLAPDLPQDNLLRIGNNTESDWIVGSGLDARAYAQRPINPRAWSGTSRTFRLVKNPGLMNTDTTGTVPNVSSAASYSFTHNWGNKGKILHYDDDDASSYPENFLPMWGCVVWAADGTVIGTGGSDQTSQVELYAVNHTYYKDG